MAVRKYQYKKYEYDFYKTRVVYKDSFLAVTEKEVKYKHIREIVYAQTFIQRWFNLGYIIIYTNAGSSLENGIYIRSIENVKEVYQEVKKLINV